MTTHPNLPADRHVYQFGRPSLAIALLITIALSTACASSVPAAIQQVLASEAVVTSASSAGAADFAPTASPPGGTAKTTPWPATTVPMDAP